jgi:ATP-binding cassette subfamily B protein
VAVAAAAPPSKEAGTITLLVSHRFSTVRMADLIVYLESGHAAEAGRCAELFTLQARAYR